MILAFRVQSAFACSRTHQKCRNHGIAPIHTLVTSNFSFRMSGSRNRKSMTPKGKKGLKEIWKRDEEDPNLINLTNQNGDIDDEVLILDSILTARIHPHRLHPSELVEGKDF